MRDASEVVLTCEHPQRMLAALNAFKGILPSETRLSLARIYVEYTAAYGLEGAYERMNGRLVSDIIANYQRPPNLNVIREGKVGSTKFTLYGPPKGMAQGNPDPKPRK